MPSVSFNPKVIFVFLCCFLSIAKVSFALPNAISVDNSIQSLIAPEGNSYQWFRNGEILNGETRKELKVAESGNYAVETVKDDGLTSTSKASVLVTASGTIVKIHLIGDSTVSNYTTGSYPLMGWGQMIAYFFNRDKVVVNNQAIPGTSSRSFYEKGYWTPVKNSISAGDFVFIQFGHNDMDPAPDKYTTTAEYKVFLTNYINETKAKGAFPVLITPVVKNTWLNGVLKNVFTESGSNYRGAMIEAAIAANVPYVDLNMKSWNLYKSLGNNYLQRFIFNTCLAHEYPNYPNGILDNTHFKISGATENARMVVEGLKELTTNTNIKNMLVNNLLPAYTVSVSPDVAGADSMISRKVSYPPGIEVTIKVVPKTSSDFLNWNNALQKCETTEKMHIFTMGNAPVSFSANFKGVTILNFKGVMYGIYQNVSGTNWTKLPDFNVLQAGSYGYTTKFHLYALPQGQQVAMTMDAYVYIPTDDVYTFYSSSADGSQLFVDYIKVVDNDGLHTTLEKQGTIALKKGYSKVRVLYFNGSNPRSLKISYSTPAISKREIAASQCFSATTGCLLDSVILVAEKSDVYNWSTGSTERYISVKADGAYGLETRRENGCIINETVNIAFNTRQFNMQLSGSVPPVNCTGNPVALQAIGNGNPPYKYQWKNNSIPVEGATSEIFQVNSSGSYSVKGTDFCGFTSESPAKNLDFSVTPDISIILDDTAICESESLVNVLLQIENPANTFYTVNVTGADTLSYVATELPYNFLLTKPGSYTFKVRDEIGNNPCFAMKSATLASKPNPFVSQSPLTQTVCTTVPEFILTGGNPDGGYWSGAGVRKVGEEYYFKPTGTKAKIYPVYYGITGTNGCTSKAKRTITANVCSSPREGQMETEKENSSLKWELGDNIPNPADLETVIPVQIHPASQVSELEIRSSANSNIVRRIKIEGAGKHEIRLDLTNMLSGVYFYSLISDGRRVTTKKLVVFK